MAMNREQRRYLKKQGAVADDGTPVRSRRTPQPAAPTRDARSSPREFFGEVRAELRKTKWPTRSEVVNYSIIVIVTVTILTSLIAGLDFLFGEAVLNLFRV